MILKSENSQDERREKKIPSQSSESKSKKQFFPKEKNNSSMHGKISQNSDNFRPPDGGTRAGPPPTPNGGPDPPEDGGPLTTPHEGDGPSITPHEGDAPLTTPCGQVGPPTTPHEVDRPLTAPHEEIGPPTTPHDEFKPPTTPHEDGGHPETPNPPEVGDDDPPDNGPPTTPDPPNPSSDPITPGPPMTPGAPTHPMTPKPGVRRQDRARKIDNAVLSALETLKYPAPSGPSPDEELDLNDPEVDPVYCDISATESAIFDSICDESDVRYTSTRLYALKTNYAKINAQENASRLRGFSSSLKDKLILRGGEAGDGGEAESESSDGSAEEGKPCFDHEYEHIESVNPNLKTGGLPLSPSGVRPPLPTVDQPPLPTGVHPPPPTEDRPQPSRSEKIYPKSRGPEPPPKAPPTSGGQVPPPADNPSLPVDNLNRPLEGLSRPLGLSAPLNVLNFPLDALNRPCNPLSREDGGFFKSTPTRGGVRPPSGTGVKSPAGTGVKPLSTSGVKPSPTGTGTKSTVVFPFLEDWGNECEYWHVDENDFCLGSNPEGRPPRRRQRRAMTSIFAGSPRQGDGGAGAKPPAGVTTRKPSYPPPPHHPPHLPPLLKTVSIMDTLSEMAVGGGGVAGGGGLVQSPHGPPVPSPHFRQYSEEVYGSISRGGEGGRSPPPVRGGVPVTAEGGCETPDWIKNIFHLAKCGNLAALQEATAATPPHVLRQLRTGPRGEALLHVVAGHGHVGALAWLLAVLPPPALADPDAGGRPPHVSAIKHGQVGVLEYLVDHTPVGDLLTPRPGVRCLLHLAAKYGGSEVVGWVAGQMGLRDLPLDGGDHRGNTALHLAARRGGARVAAALLQRGADVAIKNDLGQKAWEVAVVRGHAACAEYLCVYEAGLALARDLTRREAELEAASSDNQDLRISFKEVLSVGRRLLKEREEVAREASRLHELALHTERRTAAALALLADPCDLAAAREGVEGAVRGAGALRGASEALTRQAVGPALSHLGHRLAGVEEAWKKLHHRRHRTVASTHHPLDVFRATVEGVRAVGGEGRLGDLPSLCSSEESLCPPLGGNDGTPFLDPGGRPDPYRGAVGGFLDPQSVELSHHRGEMGDLDPKKGGSVAPQYGGLNGQLDPQGENLDPQRGDSRGRPDPLRAEGPSRKTPKKIMGDFALSSESCSVLEVIEPPSSGEEGSPSPTPPQELPLTPPGGERLSTGGDFILNPDNATPTPPGEGPLRGSSPPRAPRNLRSPMAPSQAGDGDVRGVTGKRRGFLHKFSIKGKKFTTQKKKIAYGTKGQAGPVSQSVPPQRGPNCGVDESNFPVDPGRLPVDSGPKSPGAGRLSPSTGGLTVDTGLSAPGSSRLRVDPGVSTPGSGRLMVDPGVSTSGSSRLLVDSSTSTPGSSRLTVDPGVSTPGSSRLLVDSSTSTPGSSRLTVDPGVSTPGSSRLIVDSGLSTPGSSRLMVDPGVSTPGSSRLNVDPDASTPGSGRLIVDRDLYSPGSGRSPADAAPSTGRLQVDSTPPLGALDLEKLGLGVGVPPPIPPTRRPPPPPHASHAPPKFLEPPPLGGVPPLTKDLLPPSGDGGGRLSPAPSEVSKTESALSPPPPLASDLPPPLKGSPRGTPRLPRLPQGGEAMPLPRQDPPSPPDDPPRLVGSDETPKADTTSSQGEIKASFNAVAKGKATAAKAKAGGSDAPAKAKAGIDDTSAKAKAGSSEVAKADFDSPVKAKPWYELSDEECDLLLPDALSGRRRPVEDGQMAG